MGPLCGQPQGWTARSQCDLILSCRGENGPQDRFSTFLMLCFLMVLSIPCERVAWPHPPPQRGHNPQFENHGTQSNELLKPRCFICETDKNVPVTIRLCEGQHKATGPQPVTSTHRASLVLAGAGTCVCVSTDMSSATHHWAGHACVCAHVCACDRSPASCQSISCTVILSIPSNASGSPSRGLTQRVRRKRVTSELTSHPASSESRQKT